MGTTTAATALLVLLWQVHSAAGFVVPTPRSSNMNGGISPAGPGGRHPRRQHLPVSHSSLLALADFDTMTLNWIGLAVGTAASLLVYQKDQNQQDDQERTSSQTVQMASTGTTPAPKKETAVAVAKPAAVPARTVTTEVAAAGVPKPPPVSVVVMKETQKEIQQKLQQVGDKILTTTAMTVAQPSEAAPVFTEPYSDKVKLTVKRKSRFVGKLTKKIFMPWKAWRDL